MPLIDYPMFVRSLLMLLILFYLTSLRVEYVFAQRPYITSSFPHDEAENLDCNTFIKANVFFTSEGKIIDPITLHDESVRLFPKGHPKKTVEASRYYDSENQFITLVPREVLAPHTTYIFEVNGDLVDERGFAFLPFSLEFSTDACNQKPIVASRGEEEVIEPEEEEIEIPELLNFGTQWEGDSLRISWQTDRYWPVGELVLEYANSTNDFEELSSYDVAGDVWKRQSFNWLDEEPVWGWNYYRLTFYGIDNHSFSTDTLKVFRSHASFLSTEIPRGEALAVELLLEKNSTMAFILKTRSGEIIRRKAGQLTAGEQTLQIPLQGVRPGYYIAILRTRELNLAEVIQILAE